MKKKIKFIYFDAGQVLIDYMVGWNKVVGEIVRKNNLSMQSINDEHNKSFYDIYSGKIEYNDIFKKVLKINHIDMDMDLLWEISRNYEPISETHDLVDELRGVYKLGILSNASNNMIDYSVKHGAIPNIDWDVIADSSKLGVIKPEKEIFIQATKMSNTDSENILFIDDMKENIEAAKECGWNTIWFDFSKPKKSVKEIKKTLYELR